MVARNVHHGAIFLYGLGGAQDCLLLVAFYVELYKVHLLSFKDIVNGGALYVTAFFCFVNAPAFAEVDMGGAALIRDKRIYVGDALYRKYFP